MTNFNFFSLFFRGPEEKCSRLVPRSISHDIAEQLKARVHDPVWFLTRQWQLDEFKAEDGGQIVSAELSYGTLEIDKLKAGSHVRDESSGGYRYVREMEMLHEMGFLRSPFAFPFDTDWNTPFTRELAAFLLVRLFGIQYKALQMRTEEVNAVLAKFSDASKINRSIKKHVAYAVKNQLIKGAGDKRFAPSESISGNEYCAAVLRLLGYGIQEGLVPQATFIMAERGGLTSEEAVRFNGKPLTLDDAAGISFGVLKTLDRSDKSVALKILSVGLIKRKSAEDYGLVAGVKYYPNADKLRKLIELGIFKDILPDMLIPYLGKYIDLSTAVCLIASLFGRDKEVSEIPDSKINKTLAIFKDADQLKPWTLKDMIYAYLRGMLSGIHKEDKLGPGKRVTGNVFCLLILRWLGYAINTADLPYAAYLLAERGGITEDTAQRVMNKQLIADDAVGILYDSLRAIYPDGETLVAKRTADKGISKEKAVEFGLLPSEGGYIHMDNITPMEVYLDDSAASGIKAWDSRRLEYSFEAADVEETVKLSADEYFGGMLDWYNFDVSKADFIKKCETLVTLPEKITFRGAPNPRWWSFEDGNVDFGDIQSADMNFLSILLSEFCLVYSDDWYAIPVKQKTGSIRYVERLTATDSFGIVHKIDPVVDKTNDKHLWSMYTLSGNGNDLPLPSSLLFLPNNVPHSVDGRYIEEVSFRRDEYANLVWAIEHKYYENGEVINRDDIEAKKEVQEPTPSDYPIYRMKSYMPHHWIPYIPKPLSPMGGDMVLRRGRTVEDASIKQYKGEFIRESVILNEEEIPATPIELTRRYKLASLGTEKWVAVKDRAGWRLARKRLDGQDTDRKTVVWTDREKKPTARRPMRSLKFDYTVEK